MGAKETLSTWFTSDWFVFTYTAVVEGEETIEEEEEEERQPLASWLVIVADVIVVAVVVGEAESKRWFTEKLGTTDKEEVSCDFKNGVVPSLAGVQNFGK